MHARFDGYEVPAHGNFRGLLFDRDSPEAILDTIQTPGFSVFDQWEAQKLATIRRRARGAAAWTGTAGSLWLFGGCGVSDETTDTLGR